ncbi:hypothetical protein [Chryseobacterium wanjuense]
MKKVLLTLSMALATSLGAQFFSTGTVNLPTASMTVKIVTDPTTVTMTLTGDSNSMLGIGFGSSGMAAGADGFIYNSSANRDYTFNGVELRLLQMHLRIGLLLLIRFQEVQEQSLQQEVYQVVLEISLYQILIQVLIFFMPVD